MKKKVLNFLKLKKISIASLSSISQLYGGQTNLPDCGGSNTDDDSKIIKLCPGIPDLTKNGDKSCVSGCPTFEDTKVIC
ncbi:hypothetical protein [Kordia sp.]|uniref:hypothetical protein n=1 Tax=Kordia sp. TaxID=1965332 RepID=UPI003D29A152